MHRLILALCFAASSVALAAPPRPIDRASPTTGPDGQPLSADDLKELDGMQEAVKMYEEATREYRGTVSHIVRQEFDKKRKDVQARYESQVKAVEAEEKARRADAIALFERFLQKYPNDKRWTPDVIFRLAELYFERSNEDYLAAVDAAQKAADAATKAGQTPSSNTPVTPDYTKTIDLYKRLLTDFPNYRLIDGAEYLLGYCLGEMNKEPEARQAYLALVCQNKYKPLDPPAAAQPTKPKSGAQAVFADPYADCKAQKGDSRFVPEAWTRIGEYHFDYNELELAIAAYRRVLDFKDSPYFDKALYKLAWSYYRADKYPEAIKRFDELVVYSDKVKGESGKEGSDLRQEAVQYLGISFAEKDWNGDSIDDAESGLQRIESFYKGRDQEPHVRDVYAKLGDIYFDETEYLRSIEVYKRLLQKWPLHPDNPKIQDRIVLALERMRNFDQALRERERLAKEYSKGTDWFKSNRDNKEAIDTAAELAETSLVKYAVDHHKAAQALKKLAFGSNPPDGKKLEQAAKEYSMAADGYQRYLEQYPNSKNTYEYTFAYAEALYYSRRFSEAAAEYEKVRDSNLDNKYQEEAAFDAVKSYENLVDDQTKAGRLKLPPLPEVGKVTGQPQPDGKVVVAPLTVPDDVKKLQTAYDSYAQRVPASGRLATMAYKAGEIDLRYLHFDEARPRMEGVLQKFCKDDVSVQAGKAILTSFTIENNLDQVASWTDRLLKNQCGGAAANAAVQGELKNLQADVRFKQADRLFADKKFEEAAAAYVRIVDADPSNKSGNNDKALNNAAVSFENVNRFQAATKLYERIVNEYPQSPFVDDALFRTAVNYQRFFEFDKAVVSYQRLAVDKRFKDSKHRTDSLYNAAVILENDQAYDQAAKMFQSYAADPSVKPDDRAEAYFRSGLIYLKAKDAAKASRTFREYLKTWATKPDKKIEAEYHLSEADALAKDKAGEQAQIKKIAAMGSSVTPASEAAEYPAKATFTLAEQELANGLEKMKLTLGTSKNAAAEFQKSFAKFKDEVQRMTAEYNKVIAYRRVTWTLAAYFRIGYVYELLSRALSTLATAPCPTEIMRKYKQEGCDVYLEGVSKAIEPQIAAVDEEVVKRYKTTLDQAAKLGVSNEWTKRARERANAFKPDEFPMTKDPHVDYQMEAP